ncbi:MAG: hypothetical protein OEW35_14490 [Gammaproteobacteria bacterium]|nr:hypothetical protein [Gammaproteobacteria bacterium]MDH4254876.1 hypothetical protein [Gammaproteobacteria bacterium]MDH5310599.1 hypothetical protein [Gammaproteobacteria bacterium]
MRRVAGLLLALAWLEAATARQAVDHSAHEGHDGMTVSRAGVVMNENTDVLPRGCDAISRDYEFEVRAGSRYASEPGKIFGMSEYEWRVEPCSRVRVTLINEDDVRHQWMVHGLPKYLYPAGMFHVEAMGGQSQAGTFIAPAEHANYLVHCDMAQHMEKGMRGQLVVGRGAGGLWGVTGVTDAFYRAAYLPKLLPLLFALCGLAAFSAGLFLLRFRERRGGS